MRLVRKVECGLAGDAWEAAKELSHLKPKHSVPRLRKAMRSANRTENREAAAYALTWMDRPELVADFATCVADAAQPEGVRGQAAEGLACLGTYLRRNSQSFRQAETTLLSNLDSSSPIVRFWCCFALGQMRSKRAMSRLQSLRREDHEVCPGWWKVSEEASDALHSIRTGYWPDHDRKMGAAK